MTLLFLLGACLLTCLGQVAQKFAVESWRESSIGLLGKLRSPWLWLALIVVMMAPLLNLSGFFWLKNPRLP